MTEFDWTTFGFQVFQALSPLILVVIAWAGANLAKLIKARVDNERLRDALTRLNSAVILAVNELNQTVVEEMKIASADGKITPDEKQRIKMTCLTNVKSYIGPKGLKVLMGVLGMSDQKVADAYIGAMIEDTVSRNKAKVEIKEVPDLRLQEA